MSAPGIRAVARSLATVALLPALAWASPVNADQGTANGANGVRLVVSPRTSHDLTGEVIVHVTGSGFSVAENGGVGIYLAFGRQPVGGRVGNAAFTDATVAYDGGPGHGTKWIRPQTPSGANQARLAADGTFSVDLAVRASFTAPNRAEHAASAETLGVYSFAAHGQEAQAAAFSQYAFVALRFERQPTPKPSAKPTSRPTPKPTIKPTPRPTPVPAATPSSTPSDGEVTAAASSSGVGAASPGAPSADAAPPSKAVPPSVSTPPATSPLATATARPGSSPSPEDVDSAPADAGVGPAVPLVAGLSILLAAALMRLRRRV